MRSARTLPPAWPCPGSVWSAGPTRPPWPTSPTGARLLPEAPGRQPASRELPPDGSRRRARGEAAPGAPARRRDPVPAAEPRGPVARWERTPVRAGGAVLRRRLRRLVLALMVIVGLALVVTAAWIPAKAAAAQVLLERAWERATAGEERPRPWPWADTWPVARLTLPEGDSLVVLSGASGRTLAFGPGHLAGSAEPGAVGNVVLAGHRDTHFRALADLEAGDPVLLEDPAGGRHRYRVTGAAVVHHTDTRPVAPGGDRLTLVTCWPFAALHPGGDLRYVVTAERVIPPPPWE